MTEFPSNILLQLELCCFPLSVSLSNISYKTGKLKLIQNNNEADFPLLSKKTNLDDLKGKRTNGYREYSSNREFTWHRTAPEGIYENEDGRLDIRIFGFNNVNNLSDEEKLKFPFSDLNGKGIIEKREKATRSSLLIEGRLGLSHYKDIGYWIKDGFLDTVEGGSSMKFKDGEI